MSKFEIEITESAENDLFDIGNYIAKELLEPKIAKKIVDGIGQAIFSLEEMPLRNNLVTDERLALQGIRKILIDNYIIFYTVTEQDKIVTIIRILYGKRDWLNLI
ncbi:type II toxin-antitoxin system mRNA interferase toxin, RelE/StbE family [Pseudobacteroides cellulosolvens]|uniref:Addiction module toxin, RelE/StbE family n=1 Tax=Pseudobacteroides cellulosolvens ATCC 35603 = DSM 2933 TaxID=398512 RepID=A0A0L6JQI9_9FIRM|nr:type II toxin-antitoxin system mRNA interferase toxin, RelE/StbE family [Pseudobacteroides cellulosolvens]KNY27632.1 addiction module toxin, RelE/StbE family [Pseudobacteroides cellulosolvens ATCC 35603 = DSM 2933]